MKLIKNKKYYLKNYGIAEYICEDKGDYTCDLCNKRHYYIVLPLLAWFKISEDNFLKFGTSCIKKIIEDVKP